MTPIETRDLAKLAYVDVNKEVNKIWSKHAKGILRRLEQKRQKLQAIAERTSTREGQREHMINTES
jgi:hypothetical protein